MSIMYFMILALSFLFLGGLGDEVLSVDGFNSTSPETANSKEGPRVVGVTDIDNLSDDDAQQIVNNYEKALEKTMSKEEAWKTIHTFESMLNNSDAQDIISDFVHMMSRPDARKTISDYEHMMSQEDAREIIGDWENLTSDGNASQIYQTLDTFLGKEDAHPSFDEEAVKAIRESTKNMRDHEKIVEYYMRMKNELEVWRTVRMYEQMVQHGDARHIISSYEDMLSQDVARQIISSYAVMMTRDDAREILTHMGEIKPTAQPTAAPKFLERAGQDFAKGASNKANASLSVGDVVAGKIQKPNKSDKAFSEDDARRIISNPENKMKKDAAREIISKYVRTLEL